MNASENQGLGGTMPTDADMNVLEKFVSKLVGRNVRFEAYQMTIQILSKAMVA